MMMSIAEAKRFAEQHFPNGPEKLAKHLGITVRLSTLVGCDGWVLSGPVGIVIRLNKAASESRRRFTLAHELGHVKHRDTLTMTVAATLAGAIGMLANFAFFFGGSRDENGRPQNPIVGIAMMILAPLAASLVQMAISRSREYEADRAGAEISGNPLWLASALQRLHEGAQAIPNATAEANPATAHLYIDNPLSGGGMRSLFSTHPPMEERIARLQAMAHEPGGGGHWAAPQAAPAPVRRGGSVPQTGSRGPWS